MSGTPNVRFMKIVNFSSTFLKFIGQCQVPYFWTSFDLIVILKVP